MLPSLVCLATLAVCQVDDRVEHAERLVSFRGSEYVAAREHLIFFEFWENPIDIVHGDVRVQIIMWSAKIRHNNPAMHAYLRYLESNPDVRILTRMSALASWCNVINNLAAEHEKLFLYCEAILFELFEGIADGPIVGETLRMISDSAFSKKEQTQLIMSIGFKSDGGFRSRNNTFIDAVIQAIYKVDTSAIYEYGLKSLSDTALKNIVDAFLDIYPPKSEPGIKRAHSRYQDALQFIAGLLEHVDKTGGDVRLANVLLNVVSARSESIARIEVALEVDRITGIIGNIESHLNEWYRVVHERKQEEFTRALQKHHEHLDASRNQAQSLLRNIAVMKERVGDAKQGD